MALNYFKLYVDSGLTTLFGGTLSLLHKTDLSDNPQDFTLYFGSTTSGVQLQATSDPGVDNIILTPTDILPAWDNNIGYIIGQSIEPTTPNGLRYEATTTGNSGATEPTWPTSGIGSTVVDGTVVWKLVGASHQPNEATLALTEGALDSNTPGGALSLGPTLEGGVSNAVAIWIRIENAVTVISNNSGTPEVGININEVEETEIP